MATKANTGHIGDSGIAGHSAGELFPYRIVLHSQPGKGGTIVGVGPGGETLITAMYRSKQEFDAGHDFVEGHLRAHKRSMDFHDREGLIPDDSRSERPADFDAERPRGDAF